MQEDAVGRLEKVLSDKKPHIFKCLESFGTPRIKIVLPEVTHPDLVRILGYLEFGPYQMVQLERYEAVDWSALGADKRKQTLREAVALVARLHRGGFAFGHLAPSSFVWVDGKLKLSRVCGDGLTDYCAPEVMAGQAVTPAADVYSLASLVRAQRGGPIPATLLAADPRSRAGIVGLRRALSSRRPRFSMLAVASMMLIVMFGAAFKLPQERMASIWDGFEILRQEGPGAAYRFFVQPDGQKEVDFFQSYGQAWMLYQSQEFTESERVLDRLKLSARTPYQLGAYYYLKGYLAFERNDIQLALDAFLEARDIYEAIDKENNLHRTLLALANIYLDQRDWAMASSYLDQAVEYGKHELSLGAYYHLKAFLAFQIGDLEDALAFSQKGVEAFADEKFRQSEALGDTGFFLTALGYYEEGRHKTQESTQLTVETGHRQQYFFNLINDILYAKCQGLEFGHLVEKVLGFAQETGNRKIMLMLDFVLNHSCAPPDNRSGSPDPPFDPPSDPGDDGGGGGGGEQ